MKKKQKAARFKLAAFLAYSPFSGFGLSVFTKSCKFLFAPEATKFQNIDSLFYNGDSGKIHNDF